MSYRTFKGKVNALIRRSGSGAKARFRKDGGRHYADCSDGTTIIGNSQSLKVTIKWGSGHVSMAAI